MLTASVLITGSTDGLGLATARSMIQAGHRVMLHGRSKSKLAQLASELKVPTFQADLSDMRQVQHLALEVNKAGPVDVLINNAGVLELQNPIMENGLDVRFVVNTFAAYYLSAHVDAKRVVNLSSAAQAPVDMRMLTGERKGDSSFSVYAQSKLAVNMFTSHLATAKKPMVAVNPGSYLATKMVSEGFGMEGQDITVGVRALELAAFSPDIENGGYYDQDNGGWRKNNPEATNVKKCQQLVSVLDEQIAGLLGDDAGTGPAAAIAGVEGKGA
mmetsp:Transcript_70537/g.163012  ORF Transcript_70537/g.163012 Transcript_70537/m.163012 type:complete len:272 (+) Transcript_70537:63-878(+)